MRIALAGSVAAPPIGRLNRSAGRSDEIYASPFAAIGGQRHLFYTETHESRAAGQRPGYCLRRLCPRCPRGRSRHRKALSRRSGQSPEKRPQRPALHLRAEHLAHTVSAANPGRKPTCQELIAARRQLGLPGNISVRDRLRLEVAVVDGKEMFSWAGADRFETDSLEKLIPGGVAGSGDFIGFMFNIFGGDAQTVRYTGLAGDQARFEFDVPQARSHYQYHDSGAPKITGYGGSFFLDPDNAELMKLVIDTAPFPAGEPLCQVEDIMDYQRIRIGSGDFLLPEVSSMDVIYRNGEEAMNETRYSDCHEFSGESTIRFDDADSKEDISGARGFARQRSTGAAAPRLRLRIGLAQPINGETAAVGDAVTGVLLEDARDKTRGIVAHRNDRVFGRIVRFEQHVTPAARWILQIRFDRIERGGIQEPVDLVLINNAPFLTFPEHGNLVIDQTWHSDWETR